VISANLFAGGTSKNLLKKKKWSIIVERKKEEEEMKEKKIQRGLFEIEECYDRLDKKGDPLLKLNGFVDWSGLKEIVKPIHFESTKVGGRPGIEPIVIVKCLILQSLYNLSDEACEYQINDRISFKRFVGLAICEKAPDEKTLWLYRERIKYGLYKQIFDWFSEEIAKAGYVAKEGQIIDAAFVPTHKPTGKHKKQLEEGIPLTSGQARQIDEEARFTKKGSKTYHGYKNHIQIDNKHKLIRKQSTTAASVHDSQEFANLVDAKGNADPGVWADSAYRGEKIEQMISDKKLTSHVHERAYRNKPLSHAKKDSNKVKSRIRARVEHVFGHMSTSMNGLVMHVIGLARMRVKVVLKNLAYNMQRFVFLESQKFCLKTN